MHPPLTLTNRDIYEAFGSQERLVSGLLRAKKGMLPDVGYLMGRMRELFSDWVWGERFLKILVGYEYADVFADITRLEGYRRYVRMVADTDRRVSVDIEAIKGIPIASLYAFSSRSLRVTLHPCPLPGHNDSTSSFKIYPKTNSFYCFGCHKGGDNIAFIQELHQCDFKSAIKYITSI